MFFPRRPPCTGRPWDDPPDPPRGIASEERTHGRHGTSLFFPELPLPRVEVSNQLAWPLRLRGGW